MPKVKSYDEILAKKFKKVLFYLVDFDNGSTPQSMQCYLLADNLSPEMLADKGSTALDLGNFIYRRFGFCYEMPPEYGRKGENKNSLAFYQSKEKFQSEANKHIREWLLEGTESKRPASVLYNEKKIRIKVGSNA